LCKKIVQKISIISFTVLLFLIILSFLSYVYIYIYIYTYERNDNIMRKSNTVNEIIEIFCTIFLHNDDTMIYNIV